MTEFLQALLVQFEKEVIGILGGAIFFGSWLLQAWESRCNGAPVVSMRFFFLRALASFLLTFEGIRSGSVSITLVMFATLLLMLYNMYLIHKKAP
jgi:lipid-A-disaccharide synthase-like uncharacterized protein